MARTIHAIIKGCDHIVPSLREWIMLVGAKTAYIIPGNQWENGYCDSFNSCRSGQAESVLTLNPVQLMGTDHSVQGARHQTFIASYIERHCCIFCHRLWGAD